ncbi:MAG: hypothetical protein IJI10_08510 [Eubacterium sp.]|nr:hypothetical protein [Eubacterium sp.]
MKKIILKLFRLAALLYGLLFLVFYFDLDGKLLYYVWEPLMTRRYDKMKRKDNTVTPYEMKENVAG